MTPRDSIDQGPHRLPGNRTSIETDSKPRSDADRTGEVASGHPHAMVSIRWKDAESQGGPGWEDCEEMLEFARRPLTTVHTIGLLVHADEEQIAVTDTMTTDQMGGITKIPRGWIEKIEYLHAAGAFDDESVDSSTSTDSIDGRDARHVG